MTVDLSKLTKLDPCDGYILLYINYTSLKLILKEDNKGKIWGTNLGKIGQVWGIF